jgi:hypothetical protein
MKPDGDGSGFDENMNLALRDDETLDPACV